MTRRSSRSIALRAWLAIRVAFVISPAGQNILVKSGFLPLA
jgi:hypothetical protein